MSRLLVLWIAIAACGGGDGGPFDELPLDKSFTFGLEDGVHVARDVYGIAHIRGKNLRDVAFAQGYVMAHDRLPQMDLLRRYGAGTLAEVFGALDPGVIDTDLEMRMHRMKPLAAASLEQLRASPDPIDAETVSLLERFADGVNAYAADAAAGKWDLDPAVLVSFDPERFAPWSPVDSLVLGRFQSVSLSFTAPYEIELTKLYQQLHALFPTGPRAGVASELIMFESAGKTPPIPDFPDGATTSDGYDDAAPRAGPTTAVPAATASVTGAAAPEAAAAPGRPNVPDDVLAAARTAFAQTIHTGPLGALGPHAFMQPYAGSNNWAVGPELTADGSAILAMDPHLQLANPSVFYPTHITVDDGDDRREPNELDVIGVTFPGIPGVILGSNGDLAWSGSANGYDVNDEYLETLVPCSASACVKWNGAAVPIETFDEEIRVGALGTITSTFTATYERVPHHGPVIPEIDRAAHRLVPRPATRPPLSIRYTGYEPTFEIRAVVRLMHASNVALGFQALSDFSYGNENWTMVDRTGAIGWTTNEYVPLRSPATYRWNAQTRPDDAAPFFVLSGEGAFEWEGRMSTRNIPHARTPIPMYGPTPQHYLVTANGDPVGATLDNDPLNQRMIDGRPLYVGVAYDLGLRQERITNAIVGDRDGITVQDMEALQHDSRSAAGSRLTAAIVAALGYAAIPVPAGAPADVAPYVMGLPAADLDRLIAARAQLASWSFATPAARDAEGASAATVIFNTWMHFFIEASIGDEVAAIGNNVWRLFYYGQPFRIVSELLNPQTFLSRSAMTGEPMLCDDVATGPDDDSCTKLVLSAMVAAMKHLESPAGFGTPRIADWEWGHLHRMTIRPFFPSGDLTLPRPGETTPAGFPRAGDMFNVNRADMGWEDLGFSQWGDGAAHRFIAVTKDGQPFQVRWQLPGGTIFDSRSPHYRDLLDKYYLPERHFDAPYQLSEIVRDGEARWEFR